MSASSPTAPADRFSWLRPDRRPLHNPNSLSLILTVSAFAVVLNVVGGTLVGLLAISFLFLDTIGTFLVAGLFGIRWGILVGVLSNLVLGVTDNPNTIPFALVQIAIAIIVGGIANGWGYNAKTVPVIGLLVAIIAPVIGTFIAVALFGGVNGSGLDVVVLWLQKSGQGAFSSAFWPRLGSNFIDKVLTAFLVLAIIKAIPASLIKPRIRQSIEAAPATIESPIPAVPAAS